MERVAAPTPIIPAGGSVVALCGAIAASLCQFVAHVSQKREKDPETLERLQWLAERLDALKLRCLDLMDEDAVAYEGLMRAMRLPKATPEETSERESALATAALVAMEPPLELARHGLEILRWALELAERGHPAARADGQAAAEMAHACLKGAVRLALAGLSDLRDPSLAERTRTSLRELETEGELVWKGAGGDRQASRSHNRHPVIAHGPCRWPVT